MPYRASINSVVISAGTQQILQSDPNRIALLFGVGSGGPQYNIIMSGAGGVYQTVGPTGLGKWLYLKDFGPILTNPVQIQAISTPGWALSYIEIADDSCDAGCYGYFDQCTLTDNYQRVPQNPTLGFHDIISARQDRQLLNINGHASSNAVFIAPYATVLHFPGPLFQAFDFLNLEFDRCLVGDIAQWQLYIHDGNGNTVAWYEVYRQPTL